MGTAIVEMGTGLIDRGACPLCDHPESEVAVDFKLIPVRSCTACGFLFSGRIWPEERLQAYYQDSFASPRQKMGQEVNGGVNAALIARLMDLASVRRVLDIGTGYGFLLKRLRDRHGLEVTGVEVSREESAHARETLGLDVRTGVLSDAGLPRESFDLVCSFEVIEHITQPRAFVSQMAEHVAPGGWLLIGTDNFRSAACRRLGAAFPKWIPHSHVSHFDAQTLRRCVESAPGLRVEKLASYTPWELLPRTWRAPRQPLPASACFDLEAAVRATAGTTYTLFGCRRALNPLWMRVALSAGEEGALIFALARKG